MPELAEQFAPLQPLTLLAATDGNHGRAVAAMARLLGFDARIFVPDDMVAARIAGIESEGARGRDRRRLVRRCGGARGGRGAAIAHS